LIIKCIALALLLVICACDTANVPVKETETEEAPATPVVPTPAKNDCMSICMCGYTWRMAAHFCSSKSTVAISKGLKCGCEKMVDYYTGEKIKK
jgi:hypothetical protein